MYTGIGQRAKLRRDVALIRLEGLFYKASPAGCWGETPTKVNNANHVSVTHVNCLFTAIFLKRFSAHLACHVQIQEGKTTQEKLTNDIWCHFAPIHHAARSLFQDAATAWKRILAENLICMTFVNLSR